jgi:hypothetical protein
MIPSEVYAALSKNMHVCAIVSIESRWKAASAEAHSEVEACLHDMYVGGEMDDEQMMLVGERFPDFRLRKKPGIFANVVSFEQTSPGAADKHSAQAKSRLRDKYFRRNPPSVIGKAGMAQSIPSVASN